MPPPPPTPPRPTTPNRPTWTPPPPSLDTLPTNPPNRPARNLPGAVSGFTIQPLGDGPVLAFPAGAVPLGLLAALQTFFPVEAVPPGDQPGEGGGPEPQAGDLDLGLELNGEDNEYLLI